MKIVIIVGRPQQGKTPYIKKRLTEGKNVLVFDINNEYALPFYEAGLKRSYFIGSREKFIDICMKKSNTVCVFEDATGFLSSNSITEEFKALIVNKAHKHNYYVLVFHSIGDVPKFLRKQADIYILFKTFDNERDVETIAPEILPYFVQVNKLPDYSLAVINTQLREVKYTNLAFVLGVNEIDKDKKIG